MMEGSLCLIDGRVRRKVRHCSKLMCWKHAGEHSEQIAVEAGYPSSMIVIEDQFAGVEITDEDVDQIDRGAKNQAFDIFEICPQGETDDFRQRSVPDATDYAKEIAKVFAQDGKFRQS